MTQVLLMVRVLRVVPWAVVLPVASILRVLLPLVVGLVCATGGVTVQVVLRPGAPSCRLPAVHRVMGGLLVV